MKTTRDILAKVPHRGQVTWIGVTAEEGSATEARDVIVLTENGGIDGDHHGTKARGRRQVTLIQAEHLPVIAGLCRRDAIDPSLLRRNLVVAGINLFSVRDRRFRIAEVSLQGTGDCPPCAKMEAALGEGGLQAMRGHGGITATVLEAGEIRIGDAVAVIDESTDRLD